MSTDIYMQPDNLPPSDFQESFDHGGYNGEGSICIVDRFTHTIRKETLGFAPGGALVTRHRDTVDVIVLTEPNENQGTSVTNAVEMIAGLLVEQYELNMENVIWIERYPRRGESQYISGQFEYDESFAIVGMRFDPAKKVRRLPHQNNRVVETPFKQASWTHIDKAVALRVMFTGRIDFDDLPARIRTARSSFDGLYGNC